MIARRLFGAALGLWLGAGICLAADQAPLTLGVMPFANTLALMKTHQPLRQHLEAALGRPVQMSTAPSYQEFVAATNRGDYDISITGPHFAVMAIDRGHVPLVRYDLMLKPIVLVHKDSGIDDVAALRGKSVILSNRFAISAVLGIKWLAETGMEARKDYRLIEAATHSTAIMAVALKEQDAAITTYTPLKQIAPEFSSSLKVLEAPRSVPHLMTLASPKLNPAEFEALRKALLDFPGTEGGRDFFTASGYRGYVVVTPEDIEAVRPLVPETERELEIP